jgi:RNA polymerase sigma-70 factor (ECF subfamily)
MMTDHELIEQCLKGDQRAQKALFDKFSRKMMSVCMRYAADTEIAEDWLQDGFIKVYTNLHKFKQKGSFEGWIRRTMVNTCLDHLRKSNRMQIDADISEAEYLAGEDEKAVGKLRVEELMKLIEDMPTGYRTVFNMYAIEGYSHQEIAENLGVTESTSKTQFRKARNYLMNIIVERENI